MKDFLGKFKTEKIAVHCDEEWKADKFMQWCDENGIGWNDGKSEWGKFKTETTYTFGYLGSRSLGYQSKQFHLREGYKIIKWKDIFDMTVNEPLSFSYRLIN